jgi:hypothetical protein
MAAVLEIILSFTLEDWNESLLKLLPCYSLEVHLYEWLNGSSVGLDFVGEFV